MKENKASRLLNRFLAAKEVGKEVYFDADEIDTILENLEISDDYSHYEAILSLGLRLHPGNSDLRLRQCKLLIYNEKYNDALELIESIAEGDNFDLEILRLECYCALDQYPKVVSYIENLISTNSEDLEDFFEYLAPVISDMNMNEETSDFLQRGLRIFPDNMTLKDELCLHLESIGDIKGAIKICNELIDKNPYSVDYWFMLGRLYSMSADYEKAIEAFDFALTCDDSDIEIKLLKAYCLFMNENYESAIHVYTEILAEEESLSSRINPLLADSYIKLERFEEAYLVLKKFLTDKDAYPDEDASTYLNFIRCCMETEREAEATEILNRAIALYPDNIRLLSIQAIKLAEEGNDDRATEVTEKLFNLIDESKDNYISNAESLFQAAQYLNLKDEIQEALKYYLKIALIDPKMPLINMYIAMAYLSLGDVDKFNEYYKKTPTEELMLFFNKSGLDMDDILKSLENKHIEPENLAKEYFREIGHQN